MKKKKARSRAKGRPNAEDIVHIVDAYPIKDAVVSQLRQAMSKKKISKARLAVLLKTSRSQVDRILDPERDVTLSSLQRAASYQLG